MSFPAHKCSDSVCSERYCANRCPFFTPEEEMQKSIADLGSSPLMTESLSEVRILHLWDIHVGYETGTRLPLCDEDKVAFARAVLAERAQPSSDSPASGVARSNLPDLHSAIMNLPCHHSRDSNDAYNKGYAWGHRDARHAAAELVAARAALKETSQ